MVRRVQVAPFRAVDWTIRWMLALGGHVAFRLDDIQGSRSQGEEFEVVVEEPAGAWRLDLSRCASVLTHPWVRAWSAGLDQVIAS